MIFDISAMVVYTDSIQADTEEEAIDKFCNNCPYDVDANTIDVMSYSDEDKEW